MKSLMKGFAPLVLVLIVSSTKAVADPVVWKATVTNDTGTTVVGVLLNFTGTDGTIQNPTIVMNGAGAGNATVDVATGGSGIVVIWDFPPGLPAGSTFMVQFSTDFPDIMFEDGLWVRPPLPSAPVDSDDVTVQEIPEPVSLVLLATGLAGAAVKSRKNSKGESG